MTTQRLEKIESVLSKRQNDLTIIVENIYDPHNIFAVMRTCDAVGLQEIYVLNTTIPLDEKWDNRTSGSASKWLTIHKYQNVAECFAAIREKYTTILTTHLSIDSVSLYDVDLRQSVGLVFGNEHTGVSDEVRALADGNFMIPQVGMVQSLNISVACAISLYEAFRQKNAAGHYARQKLNTAEYDLLKAQWKTKSEKRHYK